MIRPRQVRLKLSKGKFQHCQQLSQESARVWNTARNFFWRTDPSQAQDKKGIWLSESSLKRYLNGKFALHSQTVQAIEESCFPAIKHQEHSFFWSPNLFASLSGLLRKPPSKMTTRNLLPRFVIVCHPPMQTPQIPWISGVTFVMKLIIRPIHSLMM